jgi:hypothetical protein
MCCLIFLEFRSGLQERTTGEDVESVDLSPQQTHDQVDDYKTQLSGFELTVLS